MATMAKTSWAAAAYLLITSSILAVDACTFGVVVEASTGSTAGYKTTSNGTTALGSEDEGPKLANRKLLQDSSKLVALISQARCNQQNVTLTNARKHAIKSAIFSLL
jgi:hypothetical protein